MVDDEQQPSSSTAPGSITQATPTPRGAPEADPGVLARIDADLKLLEQIASADFEGEQWANLRAELARYGHAVLTGWLRSGIATLETPPSPTSVADDIQ